MTKFKRSKFKINTTADTAQANQTSTRENIETETIESNNEKYIKNMKYKTTSKYHEINKTKIHRVLTKEKQILKDENRNASGKNLYEVKVYKIEGLNNKSQNLTEDEQIPSNISINRKNSKKNIEKYKYLFQDSPKKTSIY